MSALSGILLQRLCPWNSFSWGFALWPVSETPLPTVVFLSLSERVVQHSALASLTTWYSGLGLCDHSGPLILNTLSPDTHLLPASAWLLSQFLLSWLTSSSLHLVHCLARSSQAQEGGKWPWGRRGEGDAQGGADRVSFLRRVGRVSMFHVSDSLGDAPGRLRPQQIVR